MAGSTNVTADGVVGVTGKPVRVFSLTIKSGAEGQGVVRLLDGSDGTGTEADSVTGTADAASTKLYGSAGKVFPNGLYLDLDSNVSYVNIDWEQISRA